jgi:hypothetical protein
MAVIAIFVSQDIGDPEDRFELVWLNILSTNAKFVNYKCRLAHRSPFQCFNYFFILYEEIN